MGGHQGVRPRWPRSTSDEIQPGSRAGLEKRAGRSRADTGRPRKPVGMDGHQRKQNTNILFSPKHISSCQLSWSCVHSIMSSCVFQASSCFWLRHGILVIPILVNLRVLGFGSEAPTSSSSTVGSTSANSQPTYIPLDGDCPDPWELSLAHSKPELSRYVSVSAWVHRPLPLPTVTPT